MLRLANGFRYPRTFTIVFQDENGGLELMDPHTKKFLHATPEKGSVVMNVGDMLQRFTNGMFFSFGARCPNMRSCSVVLSTTIQSNKG